jgi:hypothetical protein
MGRLNGQGLVSVAVAVVGLVTVVDAGAMTGVVVRVLMAEI